jgi:two-component system sensor histidine kinase CpxA
MGNRLYVCGGVMKPGKLYIKIFISFVIVLIITEIVIFGLFVFTAGRSARSRIERYVNAQSAVVRQYVETTIRSEPHVGLSENRSLRKLIHDLGNIYQAKAWLTGTDGNSIIQSFEGSIPKDTSKFHQKYTRKPTTNGPYHGIRRGLVHYIRMPVEFQKGERGSIHLLFENAKSAHPEGLFALGLLSIGFVIAILVVPVSRRITNPLNRLRDSALKIADGDLTHRARVKSRDEIGELGRAFNHMAAQLEQMIRGGRELTANISHELRSPLTRIRIAEELIRERLDKGELQSVESHLDDIREDIEELDRLVGQVLILSKMDICEAGLNLEPFDTAGLLSELLERLRLSIGRKGLKVQTHLVCDSPVLGDREALRTALSNILDNAVKFAPERGHVEIKAFSDKDGVRVNVTNTFEVLSTEDLARLFDPFYRAKPTQAGGSGLGLAITKKIIERHGGEIEASNTPEGLKILIRIPSRPPE